MRKKVVVLGGGTGLSFLVKGLKPFPVDISTIVSVCDDGKNTGIVREEFNAPALGDIRRVLVSLSENETLADELLNYRFKNEGNLKDYVVGNILLAALTEINGSISSAIDTFDKVLRIKGDVIPLTEDNVVLMAKMSDNSIIEGEHNITASLKKKKQVYYKKTPKVTLAALEAIKEADLIILSMGSIWTSILPNLICKEIVKEIDASKAKILYVCNAVTQPGETDGFQVSDHVNLLNKYLGKRKINVVIASNKNIDKKVLKIYETKEQKDQVKLDPENLKDVELISSDLFTVENNVIRHDSFKLGYLIYSYMDKLQ